MRTRVCVSFILRPSLLPFGFAPEFARILRETFTGLWTRMARGKRFVARADEKVAASMELEALTAGLQKVSAQLEASKPAPQVVLNRQ